MIGLFKDKLLGWEVFHSLYSVYFYQLMAASEHNNVFKNNTFSFKNKRLLTF